MTILYLSTCVVYVFEINEWLSTYVVLPVGMYFSMLLYTHYVERNIDLIEKHIAVNTSLPPIGFS